MIVNKNADNSQVGRRQQDCGGRGNFKRPLIKFI